MRKIVKRDNRKKAFLGALIGGVASIAGSAIGAAKKRKAEREQLRQQQIEQNQNDAKAQAQALTAAVANQNGKKKDNLVKVSKSSTICIRHNLPL